MDAIVISNLSIIDGSGAKPFAGEIRIEGNRIAAVARDGKALPARMSGISMGPAPR
jgi:N-acyl-D-aspartate/D-glutamate deacylase